MKLNQALLPLLVLALAGRTMSAEDSLKARVHRLLQPTGAYVATTSPDVDTYCNQKGINPSDFTQNDEDFAKDMDSVTSKYQGPRSMLIDAINTQNFGSVTGNAGGAAGTVAAPVGVPLVFAILSLISFFFMIFYIIFTACCCKKKTCCMRPKKEGDPMTLSQKCVLVTSLVLGLALIIVTIIWTVNVGSLVRSTKYFPCAVTSLFSDVVFGSTDPQYKFIGINGIQAMIKNVKTTVNALGSGSNNADMNTVKSLNLGTTGDSLIAAVDTVLNANSPTKSSNTNYRLVVGDTTTNPDSITAMDTAIGTTLRQEIDQTVALGKMFETTAKNVLDLATSTLGSMNQAFDALDSKIGPVKDQLSNFQQIAISKMPLDTVQSIMTTAMIVAIIFVLVTTILYFVILYFNLFKNKCHCLKMVNKLFMFLKMLLALAFNVLVALLAVLCIVLSNVCFVVYKASTDSTFLSQTFKQPALQPLLQSCVMPGGSGSLSSMLDTSSMLSQVTNMNNTLQSFNSMTSYASVFEVAGAPVPPVGSGLDTTYQDCVNMKKDDFASNSAWSVATLMSNINSAVTAGTNVYKLNGQCTGTIYTGTTASVYNDQSAAAMCFPANIIPYSGAAPRWTPANPTAESNYAKLVTVVKKARGSYGGLDGTSPNWYNTEWKGKLYTPEVNYYASMKTAYTKIKNIKSQAQTLLDSLAQFSGDIFKVLDCRILAKEIRTVEVAICTKFTGSLMNTTNSMTAMSIILFFFSWCICCGVRCAPQKDPGMPNNNQVAPEQVPNNAQAPGQPLTDPMAKAPITGSPGKL